VQLRLGRFAAMVAGVLRFDMSVFDDRDEAVAWIQRRKVLRMEDVKAKILEVWSGAQLTALATINEQGNPWVRYVLTTAAEDLSLRFATYRESRKVEQILANPEVHLLAGVDGMARAERWVQVEGRAEISEAPADRQRVWSEGLRAFFSGPDDPGLVVGVVRPYRIEYMEMGFTRPEIWSA
jgi:general stress protein 26